MKTEIRNLQVSLSGGAIWVGGAVCSGRSTKLSPAQAGCPDAGSKSSRGFPSADTYQNRMVTSY